MCAAGPSAASPCTQTVLQGASGEHQPFPLFADGDNLSRSTANDKKMKRAIIDALEIGTYDNEAILPAPVAADRTANKLGEGVDVLDDLNLQYDRTAPLEEEHSDEEEPPVRFNAIEMDATRLLLTQREVKQVGAELATLPFGLQVNASIDKYRGHPQNLDIAAGSGDRQGVFSAPMDEDDLESSFGVLPNTTFDPALAYHSHLDNHGLNIQQDDLVGEDNSPVDLAMEDAGPEAGAAIAFVTTTKSLEAFSWIPPSISSAFHTIFSGVSSTQTAALANRSTHVMESPVLDNSYAVDMTISEGVRLQHVVPPQDIAWPFASNGTQPLPSVEVEKPEYFIPRLSPAPVSSAFASQATSHPTFPHISSPASWTGPVPVLPSTRRSIEEHEDEAKGFNSEVDARPAIVADVQREASPLRCV